MADTRTLKVDVVSHEGSVFEGEALTVTAPAFDGEMAFYPMHAPLVGVLGFGELRITPAKGPTRYFYLAGGVVQVVDDVVTILAESVTPVAKLDAAQAQADLDAIAAEPARGDAELDLREVRMEDMRARIRVAERARLRGALTADQILEQPVE